MHKYIKGYIDVANIKNLSKNGYKLYFCCILLKSSIIGQDNFKLTDKEIIRDTGIPRNHISQYLKELVNNGLISITLNKFAVVSGNPKSIRIERFINIISSLSSTENWYSREKKINIERKPKNYKKISIHAIIRQESIRLDNIDTPQKRWHVLQFSHAPKTVALENAPKTVAYNIYDINTHSLIAHSVFLN